MRVIKVDDEIISIINKKQQEFLKSYGIKLSYNKALHLLLKRNALVSSGRNTRVSSGNREK